MTIHLPENLKNSILEAVHSGHFLSVDEAMTEAARLLVQQLDQQPSNPQSSPATPQKPIWEVAEELRQSIPPEEWSKLPTDGAAQHDHYIYGTPKRPTS